jgi:lipopolysaccharide export LptBFGC system permease protein LptF
MAIGAVVAYQILQFWFETLSQSGAFTPIVGASVAPVLFSIWAGYVYWKT